MIALVVVCGSSIACRRASRETSPAVDAGTETIDAGDAGDDAGDDGPDADAIDSAGEPTPPGPPPPLPVIPIGVEAYRQWDRLPVLHVGARTVMRSTFDRYGGNDTADASHFLRENADGTFVPLEVQGPGLLAFMRTNHWHGSPWHYVVDGADHQLSETNTPDPEHPKPGATYVPPELFPHPLAETWDATKGADLTWVPVPFEQTFELRYGRSHYGTGYYIVHRFAEGADHTMPALRSWDGKTPPDPSVLELLGRAGQDIAPAGLGVEGIEGTMAVPAGTTASMVTLPGPAVVRVVELDAPVEAIPALEKARLRIRWDDRADASVDAPIPLFFGAGTLFNRDAKRFLVQALMTHIRFDPATDTAGARVNLAAYFPMPFFTSADLELVAGDVALPDVTWRVRTVPLTDSRDAVGYFHATYTDHGGGKLGEDLVVLDTQDIEGSHVWCGTFAGMSLTFSDAAQLGGLEGDPRFFFDDNASPQAQGTGTEEWCGGGDHWGGLTMTLPFVGHPTGAISRDRAVSSADLIESAYRHLVGDAMPFGRRARIQLEHGGLDEALEHYTTVAYWYGQPGACLVLSDALHVGDTADEQQHAYRSPDASPPESLSSRYEVGVDTFGGRVIVPETADTGRHTTGVTEFRLAIDPQNVGVLLRRKFDQRSPNQRALVEIAADESSAPFVRAGVWSTPGSDMFVFSNPPRELDGPAPSLGSSNRRWREDEFLIARSLTEGRSAIRVRITFMPRNLPLIPGDPLPEQVWSEYRYWAYSWRFPPVEQPAF